MFVFIVYTGKLYDRDNADTDSVSYDGCTGFVTDWENIKENFKDELENLLPLHSCQ